MPCYYPIQGFRARNLSVNGKRPVVFRRSEGYADMPISVPCGKCIGCQLARAASWAVRATHEMDCHRECIFLTLTYAPEFLPDPELVSIPEMQKFIKRLRKLVGSPVRYLLCGEYGTRTFRPHYHLLIFGWRPNDAKPIRSTKFGKVFSSASLSALWPKGLSEFGAVGPASAGYVARYTTKKLFDTGMPGSEFLLSSRRPALGIPWLETHFSEVYPSDAVRLGGKLYRPPIAYDRWLERNHPKLYLEVVRDRLRRASDPKYVSDNDSFRLPVKEEIKKAQIRSLKRGL